MKSFKTYIIDDYISSIVELNESKVPRWTKLLIFATVTKIIGLDRRIQNETNPTKQLRLLSKQNQLLSTISGLGFGFSVNDKDLLNKIRSLSKK